MLDRIVSALRGSLCEVAPALWAPADTAFFRRRLQPEKGIERVLRKELDAIEPDTSLFWSTWGRRSVGKTRAPMTGKNIWRLCKVYGRIIGYPQLKTHDLRHGVALEVLEQHHNLEEVRALLGHARIDTTQVYTSIKPSQLKRAVAFYENKAKKMLSD